MANIIEVNGLSKSFGKVKAVNDISFYVEEGSLFSFLGTNGAGKSTTISILLTLLQQEERPGRQPIRLIVKSMHFEWATDVS